MPGHEAWLFKALSDLKLAKKGIKDDDAEILNPYATYTRYPDDRFSIERSEAEDAILKATRIFNFVKKKISNEPNQNLNVNWREDLKANQK